jgi:hypothetical protein
MPIEITAKNRSVRVEFIAIGTVGPLFEVLFLTDGVRVGHWPIHGGLALASLIENWITLGQRPQ